MERVSFRAVARGLAVTGAERRVSLSAVRSRRAAGRRRRRRLACRGLRRRRLRLPRLVRLGGSSIVDLLAPES